MYRCAQNTPHASNYEVWVGVADGVSVSCSAMLTGGWVGISGSHVRPGLMILIVQRICTERACLLCVDSGPNRERLSVLLLFFGGGGWLLAVRAEDSGVGECVCVVWCVCACACVVCMCVCVWCVCVCGVVCMCVRGVCVCVCVDAVWIFIASLLQSYSRMLTYSHRHILCLVYFKIQS